MSEFRAVSLDGEVTLTSSNGRFIFPSHRKHEVRTYKITFTDDVGNSGFTYYAQAPFSGTDMVISPCILTIGKHVGGEYAIFNSFLKNNNTGYAAIESGTTLYVKFSTLTGSDIIPDDINSSILWVTDRNGNRVGGSPKTYAYTDSWGTTTILGATFNLNGLPYMPYENYTTEQKNNATYTLHVKAENNREYTYNFTIVDGQNYIRCFGASTDSPCSWESPCCVQNYTYDIDNYVDVNCPDPRESTGVKRIAKWGSDYGDNCIIVPADGVATTREYAAVHFNVLLITPVGNLSLYMGHTTGSEACSVKNNITPINQRIPITFGVYKSDSRGNIIDNNPIYTWTQSAETYYECSEYGCSNKEEYAINAGITYVAGGEPAFRNAIKNNFGSSDEYYFVFATNGQTQLLTSKPIKAKKVNPCEGLDTSTRDANKIKLTTGDRVYPSSQTHEQYNISVYTYVDTSNGIVYLSSGTSTYSMSYYDFIGYNSGSGYIIFDDDGTGKPSTTVNRQNIRVYVNENTRYSGDNFAAIYRIVRIQANGTVTICKVNSMSEDDPPMIETTGSQIGTS